MNSEQRKNLKDKLDILLRNEAELRAKRQQVYLDLRELDDTLWFMRNEIEELAEQLYPID